MADVLTRPALTTADHELANLAGATLAIINMPAVANRKFRSAVDWMQAALDVAPVPSMPRRVYTGYRPEAQRRALRHLSYSNGLPVVS